VRARVTRGLGLRRKLAAPHTWGRKAHRSSLPYIQSDNSAAGSLIADAETRGTAIPRRGGARASEGLGHGAPKSGRPRRNVDGCKLCSGDGRATEKTGGDGVSSPSPSLRTVQLASHDGGCTCICAGSGSRGFEHGGTMRVIPPRFRVLVPVLVIRVGPREAGLEEEANDTTRHRLGLRSESHDGMCVRACGAGITCRRVRSLVLVLVRRMDSEA
jgi:hypothetical protein